MSVCASGWGFTVCWVSGRLCCWIRFSSFTGLVVSILRRSMQNFSRAHSNHNPSSSWGGSALYILNIDYRFEIFMDFFFFFFLGGGGGGGGGWIIFHSVPVIFDMYTNISQFVLDASSWAFFYTSQLFCVSYQSSLLYSGGIIGVFLITVLIVELFFFLHEHLQRAPDFDPW